MDTSVLVTVALFTKDTSCKEVLESKPQMTRVVAGRIIVFAQRNVKSVLLDTHRGPLISPGLHQSGTW
jgi:hypothetical protein